MGFLILEHINIFNHLGYRPNVSCEGEIYYNLKLVNCVENTLGCKLRFSNHHYSFGTQEYESLRQLLHQNYFMIMNYVPHKA